MDGKSVLCTGCVQPVGHVLYSISYIYYISKIQMTSKGILFIVYIIIRKPLIFKTYLTQRCLRIGPPSPYRIISHVCIHVSFFFIQRRGKVD